MEETSEKDHSFSHDQADMFVFDEDSRAAAGAGRGPYLNRDGKSPPGEQDSHTIPGGAIF